MKSMIKELGVKPGDSVRVCSADRTWLAYGILAQISITSKGVRFRLKSSEEFWSECEKMPFQPIVDVDFVCKSDADYLFPRETRKFVVLTRYRSEIIAIPVDRILCIVLNSIGGAVVKVDTGAEPPGHEWYSVKETVQDVVNLIG